MKLGLTAFGFCSCQIIFFILRAVMRRRNLGSAELIANVANRGVALCNGLLLCTAGHMTILRDCGLEHVVDCSDRSWVSETAAAISIGYFIWDVGCMVVIKYEPFLPLVLHHLGSGSAMAYTFYTCPEGVWFGAALFMTEMTLLTETLLWSLKEWRAAGHSPRQGGGGAVRAVRAAQWAHVLIWTVWRLLLLPVYFYVAASQFEATGMDRSRGSFLACFGIGSLLTVFNVLAMATVHLPDLRAEYPGATRPNPKAE